MDTQGKAVSGNSKSEMKHPNVFARARARVRVRVRPSNGHHSAIATRARAARAKQDRGEGLARGDRALVHGYRRQAQGDRASLGLGLAHGLGIQSQPRERSAGTIYSPDKRKRNIAVGDGEGGFSMPWQKNKGGDGPPGQGDAEEAVNKPNLFWRVVSACMYFIPWIDAQQLSNYFYDQWSVLLPLYMIPAWPARIYCLTPMAPIIWFFMLFSLVIRNKRLPHFLRFHTMQAMMTDIVVMLFGLTRQSLPYYVAGSWVDAVFSQYAFLSCLLMVVWCIWKTLEGYYVELPFVSEAVYIQLSIADMM